MSTHYDNKDFEFSKMLLMLARLGQKSQNSNWMKSCTQDGGRPSKHLKSLEVIIRFKKSLFVPDIVAIVMLKTEHKHIIVNKHTNH